ncbi:MAG TPA: SAM-dependent methyltransferase [Gammaproteobacteria bacterium]|nr:SAM-dependent methyltransferase [Gammaproteobacteria bacterium]
MTDPTSIRNVSDTALWVAVFRAQESERKDPLFFDPFARELAGERGAEMAQQAGIPSWPIVVRTVALDEMILKAVEEDRFDTVLNLAAGLDTRPYRLALPATLRWIEVDLPAMIEYKREKLKDAKCFCRLERHALDLTDLEARRAFFAKVSAAADKVLVVTEGLLVYLEPEQVKTLAADLHQPPTFKRWLMDIASPALLKLLVRRGDIRPDNTLHGSDAVQFKFAPEEHVEFFRPYGWTPGEYRDTGTEARRIKRLEIPLLFKLMSAVMMLSPKVRAKMRTFSGIAALERA